MDTNNKPPELGEQMMDEMPVTKNGAEILRAAAARVREGWCQESYDLASGGVCVYGAIAAVTGVRACSWHGLERYVCHPVIAAIRKAIGGEMTIPEWNDAKGQTAENVAVGLEYAALLWEQEQAQKASGEVQEPVTVELAL